MRTITVNDDECTGHWVVAVAANDGEETITKFITHLPKLLAGIDGDGDVLLIDHLFQECGEVIKVLASIVDGPGNSMAQGETNVVAMLLIDRKKPMILVISQS